MRAVHVVGHRVYTPGTKDAHGNVRDGWAEPVDLAVYAIASKGSEEPGADRDAVLSGRMLLLPPDAVVNPLDLVVIDGEDWKVEGDVADYNRGPFGFRPGRAVSLTRAEG